MKDRRVKKMVEFASSWWEAEGQAFLLDSILTDMDDERSAAMADLLAENIRQTILRFNGKRERKD